MKFRIIRNKGFCIILVLLISFAAVGQSGKEYLTKTKRSKVEVSNVEFRLRLSDFLVQFTSQLEELTDQIYYSSTDYSTKKSALQWRIYGISSMSRAINISDPVLAFYNGWSLMKQAVNFFETGSGKNILGTYTEEAVKFSIKLENLFDSILVQSRNLEELKLREPFVTQWALDHPIENFYFASSSSLNYFAKWVGDQNGGVSGNVRTCV